MRKITFALLFMLTGLLACQPGQDTIRESGRDAMIDSIVATRMEELSRQAMEDLDRRRSIEVKAKADSIVAAMTGADVTPPADHTAPQNLPTP